MNRIRTVLGMSAALVAGLTGLAGCGTQAPTAGSPSVGSPVGSPSAATSSVSTAVPTAASPAHTSSAHTSSPPASSSPSAPRSSSSSPSAASGHAGSCRSLALSMSRDERVGQLFMVGENSQSISSADLGRIANLHLGSVILLGNTTSGRSAVKSLTDRVRDAAGRSHGVSVMLAADQEGGLVQRLKGSGFSVIPSARSQAGEPNATLQANVKTWSEQLGRAGIDADLAPVADVVPTSMERTNQPIGVLKRGYGPNPATVAAKVNAFVRGMHAGDTATSVKHFPGLGRVRGNTDTDTDVVDHVTTRHDADLAGFRAGVKAGTDMVMVSSATYARIDPRQPATFSSTVLQGMIRSDLGFDGVIISDDLIGKALTSVSMGTRATRFVDAGGDLAIVGDPGQVSAAVRAVSSKAGSSTGFDAKVTAAATRVLAMKARYGLARCS